MELVYFLELVPHVTYHKAHMTLGKNGCGNEQGLKCSVTVKTSSKQGANKDVHTEALSHLLIIE